MKKAKKSALSKLNDRIAAAEKKNEIDFNKTDDNQDVYSNEPVPQPTIKKTRRPFFKKEKESLLDKISVDSKLDEFVEQDVDTPTQEQNGTYYNKSDNLDAMPEDYAKYEEKLEEYDVLESRKLLRIKKREELRKKFVSVLLIIGCVYMLFLIYGTFNTEYVYSDDGTIVAQKLTVSEIKELNEFNEFREQYLQARAIYEAVLTLDYRISAGEEDPLVIAPEYENILDSIEELVIKIKANEVSSKYAQTNAMLSAWAGTDIAVYCQRMSEAISQNNSEYANQAIEYKTIVYNDFSLITENIVTIGSTIKGVDISELTRWSPEGYIAETVGAIY